MISNHYSSIHDSYPQCQAGLYDPIQVAHYTS